MSALYASPAGDGNEQVVRLPRPADGVGAALRGAFRPDALPGEWSRFLERLNRCR